MQQVAQVWTVSPWEDFGSHWTSAAIDRLGGKGAAAKLWLDLKSQHRTGFPKRPAQHTENNSSKRFRVDDGLPPPPPASLASKVGTPVVSIESRPSMASYQLGMPKKGTNSDHLLTYNVQSDSSPPLKPSRKVAVPRRRFGAKEKITWWFKHQQETPEDPTHAVAASPEAIPATPDPKPSDSKAGGKRRRRRNKGGQTTLEEDHPSKETSLPSSATPFPPPATPTQSKPMKNHTKSLRKHSSTPANLSTCKKKTAKLMDVAAAISQSQQHGSHEGTGKKDGTSTLEQL